MPIRPSDIEGTTKKTYSNALACASNHIDEWLMWSTLRSRVRLENGDTYTNVRVVCVAINDIMGPTLAIRKRVADELTVLYHEAGWAEVHWETSPAGDPISIILKE